MVRMQGEIRKTVGSDLLLGSRVQRREQAHTLLETEGLGSGLSPTTYLSYHHMQIFSL